MIYTYELYLADWLETSFDDFLGQYSLLRWVCSLNIMVLHRGMSINMWMVHCGIYKINEYSYEKIHQFALLKTCSKTNTSPHTPIKQNEWSTLESQNTYAIIILVLNQERKNNNQQVNNKKKKWWGYTH